MLLLLLSKPVGASVEAGASGEEEAERETVKVAKARLRKVTTIRSRMGRSPFFLSFINLFCPRLKSGESGECWPGCRLALAFFRTYSLRCSRYKLQTSSLLHPRKHPGIEVFFVET